MRGHVGVSVFVVAMFMVAVLVVTVIVAMMFLAGMRVSMVMTVAMAVGMAVVVGVAVVCAIGMYMVVRVGIERHAINTGFARAAAAGGTHGVLLVQRRGERQLIHFEFFDAHFGAAGDFDGHGTAMLTGIINRFQRSFLATLKAHTDARDMDDFQSRAFGEAAAGHRVKAEGQGLGFDTGELADLDPDGRDALEAFARGSVLNELQHAFGDGHFMHGILPGSAAGKAEEAAT
jgi:hypothetical protein